jgi:Ca2+-dependent lipid-binding protein
MMYDPNVFTINLEQLLSSAPIGKCLWHRCGTFLTFTFSSVCSDTAIGVLQVTVYNARGLKGVKFGGGLPDPYVSLGLGKRAALAKTKIKHST